MKITVRQIIDRASVLIGDRLNPNGVEFGWAVLDLIACSQGEFYLHLTDKFGAATDEDKAELNRLTDEFVNAGLNKTK